MFNRLTVESLQQKLDLGHMTVGQAKTWLRSAYSIEVKARTKEAFILELWDIHRRRTN